MIAVILLTHSSLGLELLKTTEMIIGKQDKVEVLSIHSGTTLSILVEKLDQLVEKYKDGGVVIATDMFGGSPSNIAMAYLVNEGVEVITGVNLPMLIKIFSDRKSVETPQELCALAAEAAKKSIIIAGEIMKR
ncbi:MULTISPECIES: PTS sugar transporter subunit IIA [Calditerrivibrio]|jgi:PTS system mannose-specific IIA component|uniref:PTS sugar transporter subunit IIA n=1 Tax=Calditerrivibrio TaxID=545865 RepID=UPI003C753018